MWISPETDTDTFEMDELFWFVRKKPYTDTKENVYIIPLISRKPRQIVGFAVSEHRTKEVMQDIVDYSIWADNYATDGNFTYMDVDFPGRHIRNDRDKSDTHNVESVNADLRTYISGLARRSRCFFRSIETLEAVVSVFVDAYNKYGEAKEKYKKQVNHKSNAKHLHQFKDLPFSVLDFL